MLDQYWPKRQILGYREEELGALGAKAVVEEKVEAVMVVG